MSKLISKSLFTGDVLAELNITSAEALPKLFEKAKAAQIRWAALTVKDRAKYLLQLREVLLNHVDDLCDLISAETGKPKFEALANEITPCIDMLTLFSKRAPKILKERRLPLRIMRHRKSYLQYWPLGVVAVISPWNFPFLLPFADILMAIVAGNAVVFKPSEFTSSIGSRIQDLIGEAGLLPDLVQTAIGDGTIGAALIQQNPAKVFFTGTVATGKRVMAMAAESLIPVNLELGGKDPMIVLPDANLDFATSAALWGGFSNSGQVCASTERILVHESIAEPFLEALKEKLQRLRPTPESPSSSTGFDLGLIAVEKQKDIYTRQLDEAREKGARFVTGGDFLPGRKALEPTIVTGPSIEDLQVYNDETFGPVVAVTTFKSVAEAIEKANRNRYGLQASVITRNVHLGEEIAKQLETGTVTINEVAYTGGLGETPWGGIKESGIGRTHSEMGLYEFVNVRHVHKPRMSLFTFKSLWWFPYSDFQFQLFREFLNLYRRSWIDKARAFPLVLWNFVQFLKKENRI